MTVDNLPDITRLALASLRGAPLRLPPSRRDQIEDRLAQVGGEELVREVIGLVSLSAWLLEAGQEEACRTLMDLAHTTTPRLVELSADLGEALEGHSRRLRQRLGNAPAKTAPRYGSTAPDGSISIAALTSRMSRRLT